MDVLNNEHIRALEDAIDATTLRQVVTALGTIAQDKANHILDNWQDEGLAKMWEQEARAIWRLADKLKL